MKDVRLIGWGVLVETEAGPQWATKPDYCSTELRLCAERYARDLAKSWDDGVLVSVYATPERYIERKCAEVLELRGVVEKYGDDPDYARSRFRQIDLMVDQRAHDRLKIDGLEKQVAALTDERDRLRSKLEHATNVRGALEAKTQP